jgi:hypothetical protein
LEARKQLWRRWKKVHSSERTVRSVWFY